MRWFDHKSLAFAATSFGAGMISSVFSYYYVKIFLNYYQVTEGWFQVSQVVYMIWNTLNDPLFGYMQDNLDYSWAKSRRHSILYGAPWFGVAFMVAWIPWSTSGTALSGLHLMFTLCFYDALFTFVLLAHCSLFAELSRKHTDRVRLVKYTQFAGLFGSTSVFFCEYFSHNLEKYFNFQVACAVMAIIASACMVYTGLNSETEYDKLEIPLSNLDPNEGQTWFSGLKNAWIQTWQVMKERDFISFGFMNFLQTYHGVFLSGFTMIICDQLISKEALPSFARSLFYGTLSVAPKITTILFVPIVRSLGYYRLIRASFVIKICLGLCFLAVGPRPYFLMGYFLLDVVCSGSASSLTNLILSDVIDKDKALYKRRHPLSSMVFASNALVTKPAISIAPMVTVAILNRYGYELVKSSKLDDPLVLSQLHAAMFYLICFTSMIIGLLQLLSWSRYSIRNSYEVISTYVDDGS